MTLTVERLKEAVSYDPETGIFRWATFSKFTRLNIKVGDECGGIYNGYRIMHIAGKCYKAHRLAWFYMTGEWPVKFIDHIDGDRGNNRFANLRDSSNAANIQNQKGPRRDNTSGFLGVHYMHKHRKWMAKIGVGGKRLYLGLHETPEMAYVVYLAAKRRLHEGCTI